MAVGSTQLPHFRATLSPEGLPAFWVADKGHAVTAEVVFVLGHGHASCSLSHFPGG